MVSKSGPFDQSESMSEWCDEDWSQLDDKESGPDMGGEECLLRFELVRGRRRRENRARTEGREGLLLCRTPYVTKLKSETPASVRHVSAIAQSHKSGRPVSVMEELRDSEAERAAQSKY